LDQSSLTEAVSCEVSAGKYGLEIAAPSETLSMTAIDNLRTRKLQLEQDLRKASSNEHRERIESELTKIDIALGFLEDAAQSSSGKVNSK
jgi:hypothetical protein